MTNLVVLTIIGFIMFMSQGVVGPVSSLYAQELGASYVLLSVLGTTTSIFTVIASYMWGRTSDVMGSRKAFMLGGLGVLAVQAALTASIPAFAPAYAHPPRPQIDIIEIKPDQFRPPKPAK